ncbi:MAG: hypothetical protein ACK4E8_10810 [Lacibacter sp.]
MSVSVCGGFRLAVTRLYGGTRPSRVPYPLLRRGVLPRLAGRGTVRAGQPVGSSAEPGTY